MEHLTGIAIFERDFSGDHLLTWCFPSLEKTQENLIHEQLTYLSDLEDLTKNKNTNGEQPTTSEKTTPDFFFSKFMSNWHYVKRYNIPEESENKDITERSMVIFSKDLHPEKYRNLLNTLVDLYFIRQKKKTTTYLLQQYLSAFGTGRIKHSALPFDSKIFKFGEERDSLLKRMRKSSSQDSEETEFNGTPVEPHDLKFVVEFFTPETFVNYLWTSLLIRRKIMVFSQNHTKLSTFLTCLPWLVSHQRSGLDVRLIFDISESCEVQVEEMKTLDSYLVGTMNFPPMEGEEGHIDFDIFIDLDAEEEDRKVIVSANRSRELSYKTGIHQEMIRYLTEVREGQEGVGGDEVFKTINDQNSKVIQKLKLIHQKFEGELTIEDFKGIGMPNDLESFLILIATAEGLITME